MQHGNMQVIFREYYGKNQYQSGEYMMTLKYPKLRYYFLFSITSPSRHHHHNPQHQPNLNH